ncbi:hypothetical protein SOVF_138420 isoform A, partial [Spinacia oleracea]
MGMEYYVQFQKLCQIEARRYILIVGVVAVTYLMLQTFMLPYGNALKYLIPDNEGFLSVRSGFSSSQSSVKAEKEDEVNSLRVVGVVKVDDDNNDDEFVESDNGSKEMNSIVQDIVASEGNSWDKPIVVDKPSGLEFVDDMKGNSGKDEQLMGLEHQILLDSNLELNRSSSLDGNGNENVESWNRANLEQPENLRKLPDIDLAVRKNDSEAKGARRRKKVRPGMPPISVTPIAKMNRILARHLAFSRKMKPQWSSLHDRDKDIFDAKLKIINSAVSDVDKELYAPVFRNVSTFM